MALEGDQQVVLLPFEVGELPIKILCATRLLALSLLGTLLKVRNHQLLLTQLALARVRLNLHRDPSLSVTPIASTRRYEAARASGRPTLGA